MSDTIKNIEELLLDTAKKLGAESAAVMGGESTSINVTARLGKLESVERNESKSIGLQIIDNKRKVNLSSTNFNKDALIELVESAMSMIKSIPEDEFCGLADKEMLYKGDLDLDLVDSYIPENNHLLNNS